MTSVRRSSRPARRSCGPCTSNPAEAARCAATRPGCLTLWPLAGRGDDARTRGQAVARTLLVIALATLAGVVLRLARTRAVGQLEAVQVDVLEVRGAEPDYLSGLPGQL